MAIKFESNGHFWPDTELNRIKSLVALFRREAPLRKIQDTPNVAACPFHSAVHQRIIYRTTARAAIPFDPAPQCPPIFIVAPASPAAPLPLCSVDMPIRHFRSLPAAGPTGDIVFLACLHT